MGSKTRFRPEIMAELKRRATVHGRSVSEEIVRVVSRAMVWARADPRRTDNLLGLRIRPGSITVEHVQVLIPDDDAFAVVLSLREKHASAQAYGESPAEIALFADEGTIRRGAAIDLAAEPDPTVVEIPGDWFIEASVARYTCRILGIRRGPLTEIEIDIGGVDGA